jgi:hypothetical protein
MQFTFRLAAWISDRSDDGFTLPYSSMSIYGITHNDQQNHEPSLFMTVDLNKTSELQLIQIRVLGIPFQQRPSTDINEEDFELVGDGSKTVTLHLIPKDANSRNFLTSFLWTFSQPHH